METTHKSRRKLIKILALSVVFLSLVTRFLIPRKTHRKAIFRIKKADVPGGGALIFRQKKIAAIKKNNTVRALSLVCPHLGCTVSATSKGFACPCHGSVFNSSGEVKKGPADRSLKKLSVEEQGDDAIILLNS
jgi:Rieske Fe-S protein